jgi:hypothetical protein
MSNNIDTWTLEDCLKWLRHYGMENIDIVTLTAHRIQQITEKRSKREKRLYDALRYLLFSSDMDETISYKANAIKVAYEALIDAEKKE